MPPIDFDDDDILDNEDGFTFEEWFDIFKEHARMLGYERQRFDRGTFEQEFLAGKTPEDAAKEFVDEMNS